MQESRGIIERIRRINQHYQYVEVAVENEALHKLKPGESLLIRFLDDDSTQQHWDPYLREQWWPAGNNASGALIVELPYHRRYQPGQVLSVLGPVGQAYRFRKSLRNVLLLAYDSPPLPLTAMISQLLHHSIAVTMVLLGSARQYPTEHLPPEIEVIQGENGLVWADQIMTLGWADQIFVVVGQDDEQNRFAQVMRMIEEKRIEVPANYLFGVFQPPLPCGTGGCSACLVRSEGELVAVCTRGPAFDLTKVQLPKA
jgi:hypothetical protein